MGYVKRWSEYRVENAEAEVVLETLNRNAAIDEAFSIGGVALEDVYTTFLTESDIRIADYRKGNPECPICGDGFDNHDAIAHERWIDSLPKSKTHYKDEYAPSGECVRCFAVKNSQTHIKGTPGYMHEYENPADAT